MMDRAALYGDIAKRTDGDIYIGVVGPVRTGKSTFIKRFMDVMVLPDMQNEFEKTRVTDELPQSAAGKTIMTTQPKFVPGEAVELRLEGGVDVRVRIIDCVGYMVPGATGHEENNAPRMVRTPWFEQDIPFEDAAEIGTHKVISEHSTIAVLVTTDGSITQIPRENYRDAEKRVADELTAQGKPFVAVLNSTHPQDAGTIALAQQLSTEYGVPVAPLDAMNMDAQSIQTLLYDVLMQFPVRAISLALPAWICALPPSHWLMQRMLAPFSEHTASPMKMCNGAEVTAALADIEDMQPAGLSAVLPGTGEIVLSIEPCDGLFYRILGEECGCDIENDAQLIAMVKDFVSAKRRFDRIADALEAAEATGYGVVGPDMMQLALNKPELMQRGGKYGVKLNAHASGLHIIKVDVDSEIAPLVGSEAQATEFREYLLEAFEGDAEKLGQVKIFGKPLYDLVCDELTNKAARMPQNAQMRLQHALQRMVNDECNSLICIVL